MDLIWAKGEGIYFCSHGWTDSISLSGFKKFAVWRKGADLIAFAPNSRVHQAGGRF
jgi:hypothetical protein